MSNEVGIHIHFCVCYLMSIVSVFLADYAFDLDAFIFSDKQVNPPKVAW